MVGCNGATYRNIIKCALWPRARPTKFLRTFKTTASNGSNDGNTPPEHWKFLESPWPPPPNPHARDIAVLGGGLTGLATAFHISRQLPSAKITVFEKNHRLGGWVDSESVEVDDGKVLFEWGPRTIRSGSGPSPLAMIELVGISSPHCLSILLKLFVLDWRA